MNIQENIPLAPLTTFKIGGPAHYFVEVKSEDELKEALGFGRTLPPRSPAGASGRIPPLGKGGSRVFILGGGSNILVSDKGFEGLVIRVVNKGIKVIKENPEEVLLQVGSGEIWDNVVKYAVDHDLWGIENLSIVPGNMGSFAVQNMECYGQQASDVIVRLKVYDKKIDKLLTLSNEACKFGYRKSIFNTEAKGRYIILSTVIKLVKRGEPKVTYPDVIKYFSERNITSPKLTQMRQAIITIRNKKFASPDKVGTAGSFFKNFLLSKEEYQRALAKVGSALGSEKADLFEEMRKKFPTESKVNPAPFSKRCWIKIPAAFIIDKILGLKGEQVGGAQLSSRQAIAIINVTNQATANEALSLFKKVRQEIYFKTGLKAQNEPELVGFSEEELAAYFDLG